MNLLELFKGTGSVGRVATRLGYTVTSLDIDPKTSPDICSDIMSWDYTSLPKGHFHTIWASPLCTYYSAIQRFIKNDQIELRRQESDQMVQRVLDIIEYFQPVHWFIENPQSGALKNRAVVQGLPFHDADYCQYGFPYRKRTRFWTNRILQLKLCSYNCPHSDPTTKRHLMAIGQTNEKTRTGRAPPDQYCRSVGIKYNLKQRYSIPESLLEQLLKPRVKLLIQPRNCVVPPCPSFASLALP